jgi:hypothetical protein
MGEPVAPGDHTGHHLAVYAGGIAMCHEWWQRRRFEEREASRRMWDEFERTRPLSDPEVTEEEPEVTLETQEKARLAAED